MSYVRDTYITNYFYFFDGVVKLLGGGNLSSLIEIFDVIRLFWLK